MTNDELNEKIRQACTHAAPDVLDAVLSDCNEQKGRVILMTTENKKKTWAVRMAGLAAGLCLILGGGLGVRNYQVNHTVDATVSLDVNPSVEIKINQKERILDVIPLNEDGRTIVGDMDFSGSSLDVAVNAIIGSMLQNGYLNELANSVLISVDNNDPVRGMALQERLADEVNKLLQTDSFRGAVLSQTVVKSDELQQMAEQYGITLGKAQLIQEILGKNSLHTFDELAPLSINELNILLGKEGAETHVEVVGTASEKGYIGETKAKEIALAKAGVSESDLTFYTVGLDTHKGVMVYDVEFISGSYEFDCEVNAMTGEIVKFEKEYDGAAVSNVSVEEHGEQSEHSQTEENQAVSNISLEKAKEIALDHAGVKATDATFVKAKSDYEDGRAVFEIEFVVSSGPRTNPIRIDCTDRIIRPGDIVFVDINGASFQGYKCCYYRSFVCGKATEEQKEVFREARDMMYAAMDKIKAGATTRDLCEVWPDSPTYWGYEPDEWDKVSPHAVGHGIGLSLHEFTLYSRTGMGGDSVLEEGMVLALETWCGKKGGDFGIRVEENVVVRKDGYELLTKFPIDELIECPF